MSQYVGRFAPSPTGRLHFGSLVAAVGSYLQARHYQGRWLLRIEDLDPPRQVAGSVEAILRDLHEYGMQPDETPIYQSDRDPAYLAALQRLLNDGLAFPCACSRKQLRDQAIYPGTCRDGMADGRKGRSVRLRVDPVTVCFNDRIQGARRQALAGEVGDFIIRRGDGLFAYQLAVVVDDAWQGITEVVRGADLIDSTPRQIYLFRRLGLPEPAFAHLPVVTDDNGRKLSKRDGDDPLDRLDPAQNLRLALVTLGHPPPSGLNRLEALWSWALAHWSPARVPAAERLPLSWLQRQAAAQ